jgi:hypothetical protein
VREDRRKFLAAASISLDLPSLFYASLRDPRLFRTVVGRSLSDTEWELVRLNGFQLAEADAGTGYPGIFPARAPRGATLECLLVHDLTRFEQTMVAWYEWDEYNLQRVPLADGRSAQVFLPDLEAIRREYGEFALRPWSFRGWQAMATEDTVENARAWMNCRPADAALLQARCFEEDEVPGRRRATG